MDEKSMSVFGGAIYINMHYLHEKFKELRQLHIFETESCEYQSHQKSYFTFVTENRSYS